MQNVVYHFHFADGRSVSIATDAPAAADVAELPAWTALDFHQCPNCPLQRAASPHCPMAVRLVPLVARLGTLRSFEEVVVHVDAAGRRTGKRTTAQRAIGGLMGLLCASSDCPHAAFLKPMAHFHQPFASEEETIYRSVSTYLLGQYFIDQEAGSADWTLDRLKASYMALQCVNTAMSQRLRHAAGEDGTVNGLVLLDLLAKALPYSIDDRLDDIRAVFVPAI